MSYPTCFLSHAFSAGDCVSGGQLIAWAGAQCGVVNCGGHFFSADSLLVAVTILRHEYIGMPRS